LIALSARDAKLARARVVFVLGMVMTTVIGAVLDAAAYGFAAQSVIAPFNGVEISLNILLAPCILHEKVNDAHVIGTLLVAAGGASTAVFGPHGSAPSTLEEIQDKLFRWSVLIYIVVFGLALAVCAAVIWVRPKGEGDRARGIALGLSAGALAGNMCFVKCVMGLLRLGLGEGDWSPWSHWLPYVLLATGLLVALGNVPLMVMGLREYEAVLMVTLFGGSEIIMDCVSGAVVLMEMQGESSSSLGMYCISIVVVIIGLVVINCTPVHGVERNAVMEQEDDPRVLIPHPPRPLEVGSFDVRDGI